MGVCYICFLLHYPLDTFVRCHARLSSHEAFLVGSISLKSFETWGLYAELDAGNGEVLRTEEEEEEEEGRISWMNLREGWCWCLLLLA